MALGLIELKQQFRGASLPLILNEARIRKILPRDFKVANETIYRLFRQRGLMSKEETLQDRRKFEAKLPNDIWQSDCMHGPLVTVEGNQKKSYLFSFLDDMSRLLCHAEFYLNERIESYSDALRKALKRRGLPRKLYVDNGPNFRSHLLSRATASLGIALIHSTPYQPQGRGKIERWHRTVRAQVLSCCPVEITLQQLNEALWQWVQEHYNVTAHTSTRQTPLNRYLKHAHLLREAPKDLDDHFRVRVTHKVDRDRTVSLKGRLYEAPVHLIDKMITLLFHEDDPSRVEAFHEGASQGMILPLDLRVNCRVRRKQHIVELVPASAPDAPEDLIRYTGGELFALQEDTDGL